MEVDTVLGLSSIHVSIVSAIVSLLSFSVAVMLAWKTKFSPAKLIGSFPYLVIWRFDQNSKDESEDIYLVPFIWMSNIGAQSKLIDEIRVACYLKDGSKFYLYPQHSVPVTAIERPNTYSDFELIRLGEAPFSGFSLANSERWKNSYAFPITKEERASLKDHVRMALEVRDLGKKSFRIVISENINFSEKGFDWAEWAGLGGPGAEYYYRQDN